MPQEESSLRSRDNKVPEIAVILEENSVNNSPSLPISKKEVKEQERETTADRGIFGN